MSDSFFEEFDSYRTVAVTSFGVVVALILPMPLSRKFQFS
jgi:hypothetical protein